jgi:CRP-like cAMP-binding protein
MASHPTAIVRNRLLALLPPEALVRLLPKLSPVAMPVRQAVYRADGFVASVYFPESGMISLVTNLEDGTQAEVGLVGAEGMLGSSLLFGVDTSFVEAVVQMPGTALRMGGAEFGHELEANALFRTILLRYAEAFQAQVMQTATCNGRHGLGQRLARWLLMAHDRAGQDALPLTQEFLAMMIGVHRSSITAAARLMQASGLIRYAGGRITVTDRTGIEAASCECYRAVTRRFDALFGRRAG